ncbi:Beta-lactamase/transpeptidase-like protein [Niveomyces insectorum RCEF 264]|uniref:Beta-lactamase/transpeptidase-like protein n=1 Tax=Niveomyces insectorum RCEF 264 TaxID=1081102 RepID=A0A162MGQ5_9HYPO|nr:Beta-lactamase/transpeptidase-like protein [Niveomyces insectorum RCEF 264]
MSDEIEMRFKSALDVGKINGAVLCATNAAGNFVYNNALGHRILLSGETRPQQLDDILCIALATKLVTTIAALQCVEDGLLTLDGDLAAVAPELAAKQVLTGFSGEDNNVPLLESSQTSTPITLTMLLTHTCGQSYYFLDPNIAKWRNTFAATASSENERQPVEDAFDYPLSFPPGTGWMYGPGVDWAGRIVERVTGRTLGEHVQQRILAPLGIADAQFYPVTRADLRDRLVDLNPQDPGALGSAVLGGGGAMNKHTRGDFGGHGLFMAAVDYAQVLRALLANDGTLLRPATVDAMFADTHLTPEAAKAHEAALAGPLGAFFRPDPDTATKTSHGLGGLLTLEDAAGWHGARTLTWGGGLTLVWFVDRTNDLCGICAIQPKLPIGGSDRILHLKQVFSRGVYKKHAAWKAQQQQQQQKV